MRLAVRELGQTIVMVTHDPQAAQAADRIVHLDKGNIVAGVPTGTGVMVMANRNVHVFDNEISGNQSAGVMLVSYTQAFNDPTYNPLPRDIVVRDNRIGRNGWDPQFPGGPEIVKALGGPLPPVIWDGVTTVPGQPAPARVRLADGPVLNLNLPGPGRVDAAAPTVAARVGDAVIPEPAPVRLEAARP